MSRNRLAALRVGAGLCSIVLLAACGGKGSGGFSLGGNAPAGSPFANRQLDPPAASDQTMQELSARLAAELAQLGKSASATARLAPSAGSEVRDLRGDLLDADGNGSLAPYGVSLRWAERLPGDYDQNGEVNFADLTKLGQYIGYKVEYEDADLHGGVANIPAGDPADFGDVAAGDRPAPDSGAFNWRLARVDGNGDGEIGISDVTAIAQHWQEAVTGYMAYRKGPGDADFVQLKSGDAGQAVSLRRFTLLDQIDDELEQFVPLIYAIPDFFILDNAAVGTQYVYKVAPYCSDIPAEGPLSPNLTVNPFTSEQGNDGVIPDLKATVLPAGSTAASAGAGVEGPAPLKVHFDARSSYVPAGKIVSYLWDFDGDRVFEISTGSTAEADHTYTDNARFDATVRLLTVDDPTLKGTSSAIRSASNFNLGQVAQVEVVTTGAGGNQPPLAKLTASKTLGSVPLTVQFDAALSTDADGTLKFYEWDFDDDGVSDFSSTTPTATYTFGVPGLVNVNLKVIDDDGGYDTVSIPVITSNPDGNWPPTASLVANPAFGSAPLDVSLIAGDSLDPDGQIVKYEWDLNGDFAFDVDSGPQAQLDYTFPASGVYNVWLRTTDAGGLTDLARAVVKVNTPPFGGLEASPAAGPGPLTVQFDASSSLDLDGTIVKYEWDFNGDNVIDLDTGTVPRATKTFYKVGVQTVAVKLTDNLGFSGTATIQVEVKTPKNNLTPLATLVANVTDGSKPLAVTFTASGSDPDPDGSIDHFDWDFNGDGQIDDQTDALNGTLQHTYPDYGLYHARVIVVDNAGSGAEAALDIKVWDGTNQPPAAAFTVNPSGGPPSTPLSFSAASSTDPEGAIASYEWDFDGDGTVDVSGNAAAARDVSRTFSTLGSYHVVLRIVDAGGSQSIAVKDVVVGKTPVVRLVADRAYAEVPNAKFSFDASRSTGEDGDITNFEWDLNGDGTYELSTGVSPFASVTFQLSDLAAFPGGAVSPRLRCTNEIGAVTEQAVVMMPALDALGQPLRDGQGNLVLDVDGGVLLAPVALELRDHYDEVEGNDNYQNANYLLGPGAGGSFGPSGNALVSLQPTQFSGTPIAVTRTNATLGKYAAASLGERNLAEIYDGDDDDWYAFTLNDGAHVTARVEFDDHATTDLILRLYNSNGVEALAQSQSGGDEKVEQDFRDPGTYYLRVNRFVGQGQDYRLSLTTSGLTYNPEGTLATNWNGAKAAGDNHDAKTADNLQAGNLTSGPLISEAWGRAQFSGSADTEDWYYFNYASAITVRAALKFSHARGDLDLFLYDYDAASDSLTLLGYSNSADDDEELWRTLPAPGGTKRVFVRVVAYGGGGVNYTLNVGFPAGQPTGLTATDGSTPLSTSPAGKITVAWTAPTGGNPPGGYDLYASDSEFGIYTLLAADLVSTTYVHDLTAAAKVPLQNSKIWYKVKATITGQQDSDFSNADAGFVNGLKPAAGLTATNDLYVDHIDIAFFSAPSDPAFGTGNFGVAPAVYRVYADPAGALPSTLIASFAAGSGDEALIPAAGSVPEHMGERFAFSFTGLPIWTQNQIRGLDIAFTVRSETAGYSPVATAAATGGISGIDAPATFTATRDIFPDKVRLSWTQPISVSETYPDGYIIQFQGQFDSGWTNLTTQPIPFDDGTFGYDYYVGGPGQVPPARRYRIRSTKTGVGNSPWAGNDRPYVYGWPSGKGMVASYSPSHPANDDITYTIPAYPQDAYFPSYFICYNHLDIDRNIIGVDWDETVEDNTENAWTAMSLTNTTGYSNRLNGPLGEPSLAGQYFHPVSGSNVSVTFAYINPDVASNPSSGAPPLSGKGLNGVSGQWHYVTITQDVSY